MIHSAAPSLSSSIALAAGMPAVAGEEGAGSADFAALLGSTLATGEDGVTNGAAMPDAAIGPQLLQPSGKTGGNIGGKTLPFDLTVAASAETTAPGKAAQIVLPGLVIPIAGQQADMPVANQATADASTAARLARNVARTIRQASPADAQNNVVERETAAAPEDDTAPAIKSAPADASPVIAPVVPAAVFAIPVSIEADEPAPVAANPERKAADAPVTAKPTQVTDARTDRAEPKATVASPAQPGRTLTVGVAAAEALVQAASTGTKPAAVQFTLPATDLAATEMPPASGEPRPAGETTIRASAGAIRVTIPAVSDKAPAVEAARDISVAIVQSAPPALQAQLTAQQAATTKEASLNARQPNSLSDHAIQHEPQADAQNFVASSVNRAVATESTAKLVRVPMAASAPQPVAAPDAPALVQPSTPAVTAPATPAATPTGHDFAALVDRLVDAREAAMPQAVHAAIRHGEFGQISLRFDQDANGLSVSMASADPEFAGAVHASSMSGHSQTASDNGSNAPRQDARGDALAQNQANGSPSGQSQGSARNDRSGQTQSEARSGSRTAGQEHQADQPADTRGGIYA